MNKYDIIIAIDPDVDKSGVAWLEVETRELEISSLTFPRLIDYLQFIQLEKEKAKFLGGFNPPPEKRIVVVVESGWLNRSNWHLKSSDTKRIASAKGNSTGRNHEVGRKIVEMAKHYGFEIVEQAPLRKCWKGKDGKITAAELRMITGITGRTNQDTRDAALLAWWYAGLPIKMKV